MECRSKSLSSKNAFEALQEQNFCNTFTTTTTRVSTTAKTLTPFYLFDPPFVSISDSFTGTISYFSSTSTSSVSVTESITSDKKLTSMTTVFSITVSESMTPDTGSISTIKASSVIITEPTKHGACSVSTADYSSNLIIDNYLFDTGNAYENNMWNGYLRIWILIHMIKAER